MFFSLGLSSDVAINLVDFHLAEPCGRPCLGVWEGREEGEGMEGCGDGIGEWGRVGEGGGEWERVGEGVKSEFLNFSLISRFARIICF